MTSTKKRLDDIFKRLDELNAKGLQLVLDMITNLDEGGITFKIKVLDRFNTIIQEENIPDVPREYLDKYIDQYKIQPKLNLYYIKNGVLEYQPTLLEREIEKQKDI